MAAFASNIPEPTVAELSSFLDGTLELVVETIGFVGDYSDPLTVPGSLFVLLAGNAADMPDMTMSDLAGISYAELESILQEWSPPHCGRHTHGGFCLAQVPSQTSTQGVQVGAGHGVDLCCHGAVQS